MFGGCLCNANLRSFASVRACWMKVSDEDGGALGALGRDHGSWGKKRGIYSLRGSSPRPMAHKTIALTTELREP